jgi:hypothetical protein
VGILTQEIYFPHKYFKEQAALSNYDLDLMGEKYDFARLTDAGYPVFGIMKAINTERKNTLKTLGVSASADIEESKLDYELKKENIMAKRILNQAKLGVLISKEEATERVKLILRAVVNIIKVGIKNSASKLFEMKSLQITQRDVETVITKEWNAAIDELKNSGKVISWDMDGSSRLLQTRLSDLSKEDPEFCDVVKHGI